MIKFVTVGENGTASAYITKGKKGVHNVEIFYLGKLYRYEVNKRDLEPANRTKDKLVDMAVHELLTELNARKEKHEPTKTRQSRR